ncbi:hypothetical protein CLOP_g24988, partial [Closterium sp. NIES-67]
HPTHL